MCCENSYTPITYKYLPTGDVVFQNKLDKYITLKDTIKGPFDIYLQLDTEKLYAFNFSMVPMAFACKVDFSDTYLNRINIYKLDISIDNEFIYKDDLIRANSNIMNLDSSDYKFLFNGGENRIIFEERFLYYAKFNKGLTIFTISGELEDGQKFTLEKQVYLDL